MSGLPEAAPTSQVVRGPAGADRDQTPSEDQARFDESLRAGVRSLRPLIQRRRKNP